MATPDEGASNPPETIVHQSGRRRQRSRQDAFQHHGHRYHTAPRCRIVQSSSPSSAMDGNGCSTRIQDLSPQPPRRLPAPGHGASDSRWQTPLSPNGSVCGIATGESRNEVYHSNRRTVRPPTVQWSPPAAATATMAPPRQVHDGDEAPFSLARTSTPRATPPTPDSFSPLAKIRGTNLCGLEPARQRAMDAERQRSHGLPRREVPHRDAPRY
jgi:hypothetical protein